ncbi:orotidine-5'-phosphate decarboxylase [Microbacterium horticulturae]|uniref:Orotidine-5'-phosphate decarboxylase n=1 Tax=Microbacterium horticulturae TaxID=3028316 RepID=A0ABY8C2J5_9MICO|nr:orotidine-5'-phosphate decarboxylase [Microbacterium sp. KACC 23027]WEG10520.1 orotidine-5'-phosphate decarboxylase [Microbacterium sp. KACC 23027]
MTSFGERLQTAVASRGRLCVGIDPHAELLEAWGLDATAAGARELGLRAVEAAAGRVAVVKPQVAFFERHGAAGFSALEDVMRAARDAGLLVIADAKRGDIGSTMRAYAEAWLTPGSPLEADALTVSPYLGAAGLAATAQLAARHGKGLFVLAATSNPEGAAVQRSTIASGVPLAADIAARVRDWDAAAPGWHAFGVVIGATVARADFGLTDDLLRDVPVLAPGFGAQGARLADAAGLFGALAPHVLASASRSILSAGPAGLAQAIDNHVSELEA